MGVVQDANNWRKSEADEWKQAGGRTGYSAHIREVMADMKAGPGHIKPEDRDTAQAIVKAQAEMKERRINTTVDNFMEKEMYNFDRAQKGLSAMPDPQGQMNRASGAWSAPAHGRPDMGGPDPARMEAFNNRFNRSQPSPGGMQ
jgi:hypothetical protein